MFTVSVLLLLLLLDGGISQTEGILLVSVLIVVMIYLIKFQPPVVAQTMPSDEAKKSWWWIIAFASLGTLGLALGSQWLVKGAVGLARTYEVSERIIGVTLVSIGTSLPELVASGLAMYRKEQGISIGNLIGSNLFNILTVLGVTAVIHPLQVMDARLMQFDIWKVIS